MKKNWHDKKQMKVLKFLWKMWINLGLLLGLINTTVILTLFYFVMVTPIGLFRRIFKCNMNENKDTHTYWLAKKNREPTLHLYTRQF